jgi:uncharacterized protein (TIGR00299 family) protein
MRNALVLDPFSGVSGDMFLAALIDVGAQIDSVRKALRTIPELASVSIETEAVRRGVLAATRVKVVCPEEHAHRSLSIIRGIIDRAPLDERVKTGAVETFAVLAQAEAKVHGCGIEEVHFHEVGALDAIADIVGAHVALALLGSPECYTRAVNAGSGTIRGAHGDMPAPAPATLELLSGYPVRFSETDGELVTPTGAALLASIARPLGAGTLVVPERVGYGAGSRERDGLPNVLRAILGRVEETRGHVCIVTSTLDDMNPQVYGYLMEQLFANGALEVYYNPVMMKKNRPGVEVTLIGEEKNVYDLANLLMTHTTTLGVRIHREERMELARRKAVVETPYGAIDVKVALRPDGREAASPEYESCKRVAAEAGVTLLEVYEAVRKAWDKERTR